jgi:PAS domain S-box-containing protein
MGLVYEIRLAEPPEPAWVEQFAGWEVQAHPGGGALLRGGIAEHAALLDLHTRVQHMGLTLLELRQVEAPSNELGEEKEITELRRRLHEHEALWRLTFDAASDAMGIRDADGRMVDVNPSFARMHGYAREELIGTVSGDLKDAEDIRRYALYLEAIRTGQRFHTTGRNRHKDGTRFPVEVHGYPFTLGGAPHMLAVIRDATDEVRAFEQAQERAHTSARELTALLEVARQVTSSLDLSPLLHTILAQLRVVFDYAGASVFLREGPDELALIVYEGPIPEAQLPTRWSIGPRRPESSPLDELIAEAEQAHPAAQPPARRRGTRLHWVLDGCAADLPRRGAGSARLRPRAPGLIHTPPLAKEHSSTCEHGVSHPRA